MLFLRRSKNDHENPDFSPLKTLRLRNGEKIILNSRGLLPVILQDWCSNEVIHLGYMNAMALEASLESRIVHLFRRSSGQIEKFGENKNLEYKIKSFKLHSSKRSMLLTVHAADGSVTQSLFGDIVQEPVEENLP